MSEGGAVLLYKSGGKQASVKFNVGEDYRLIQTIGTGAYGVVCSAIHSPTGLFHRLCPHPSFALYKPIYLPELLGYGLSAAIAV